MDAGMTAAGAVNNPAEDVVSHDIVEQAQAQAQPTKASNKGSPVDDIVAARNSHDAWFNGSYARSNAELYNLLAQCLDAYERMKDDYPQKAAFRAEYEKKGLRFKKTTPVLNRVVQFVFGTDRRRVSGYARVLARAHADGVDAATLHTWIANNKGVEEIRAKQSGGVTPAERAAQNRKKAEANVASVAPVAVVNGVSLEMRDNLSPYVAAIARVKSDGSIEVLTFVTDEGVVKSALAAYGAKVSADDAEKQTLQAANSAASAVSEALAA